jgi:hypothetical protein
MGLILEQYLLEYSKRITQQLISRFKKEDNHLTDEQIVYYITRFEEVKASPKVVEKDILKYSFADLEKTVDMFPKKATTGQNSNTAEVRGQGVYDKDGVEVYLGDEKYKCIKYREYVENEKGTSHGWCIARKDGNMFNGYRFGGRGGNARVFYFVIDRNKDIEDPNHAFVVHVFDNGEYGYTSAFNDGDVTELSWGGLVKKAPVLSNIPQDVFKSKPLSEKEKELYHATQRIVLGPSIVEHFNSNYEMCKAYIELHGHRLTYKQVGDLLNRGGNWAMLVNFYITMGQDFDIPGLVIPTLPDAMLKNYARVGLSLENENSSVSAERAKVMVSQGLVNASNFKDFSDTVKLLFIEKTNNFNDIEVTHLLNKAGENIIASLSSPKGGYRGAFGTDGRVLTNPKIEADDPYLTGSILSYLTKRVIGSAFYLKDYDVFAAEMTHGASSVLRIIDEKGVNRPGVVPPNFSDDDLSDNNYPYRNKIRAAVLATSPMGYEFTEVSAPGKFKADPNIMLAKFNNIYFLINSEGEFSIGNLDFERDILPVSDTYTLTGGFNTRHNKTIYNGYNMVERLNVEETPNNEPLFIAWLNYRQAICVNKDDKPTLPSRETDVDESTYSGTQHAINLMEGLRKMKRLIDHK